MAHPRFADEVWNEQVDWPLMDQQKSSDPGESCSRLGTLNFMWHLQEASRWRGRPWQAHPGHYSTAVEKFKINGLHNLNRVLNTSGRRPIERAVTSMEEPQAVVFPEMNWFLSNFDHLIQEYSGEWIAIVGEEVVAHASSPYVLRSILKEKRIRRSFITRATAEAWGV